VLIEKRLNKLIHYYLNDPWLHNLFQLIVEKTWSFCELEARIKNTYPDLGLDNDELNAFLCGLGYESLYLTKNSKFHDAGAKAQKLYEEQYLEVEKNISTQFTGVDVGSKIINLKSFHQEICDIEDARCLKILEAAKEN
jgi:TorA maturation chaperone TorD